MGTSEKYAATVTDSGRTKMQSDEKRPEIRAILERKVHVMADRTIAPIVPRIIYEAWLWRKIFWLICYITCWFVFILSTYELIVKYHSYSVNTEIKIQYYPELQFPAVTVCDMNRIDKESSDGTDVTGDLLHSDEALWMSVFEKLSRKYSSGDQGFAPDANDFIFHYTPCPSGQFRCDQSPGKQCFDDIYKCDFLINCHNGEDEQSDQCPFNSPKSSVTFGDLVAAQQSVCQVLERTGDYDDVESFLRQHYLHCCDFNQQTNRFERVLPPWTRCDGFYHCRDQTDEKDCEYAQSFPFCKKNPNETAIVDGSFMDLGLRKKLCLTVAPTEMECKRWCKDECLDASLVCDGKADCPNGLDEYNCESPASLNPLDYSLEIYDEDSSDGLTDFNDANFEPSFEDEVYLNGSESLVGQLRRTAKSDPYYTSVKAKLTQPERIIAKHGMSRESLINLCTYNNYPCTGKDQQFFNFWKGWKDMEYGNCYTFNHALTNFSLRKDNMIKSTGPSSGLHLTLSVDASSYMPLLTNAVGVVLAIHSNQGHALPKLMGTLLRPGTLNRLAVEKQQVNKVGPPYSTCVSSYPDFILQNDKFITEDVKRFLTTYHPALCAKLCQALHQLLSCSKGNCRYGYLLDKNVTKGHGIPDCDMERITHFNCFQETKAKVSSVENCGCKQGCVQQYYQHFLSTAEFPSPAYVPFLLNSILEADVQPKNNSKKRSDNKWMDKVAQILSSVQGDYLHQSDILQVTQTLQKSLIDVEVFYNSLYVTEIAESPAYTLLKLLADFGGNSGLYVGFCALSLFEILEFMWDVMYAIVRRKLLKEAQDSSTVNSNNGDMVTSC